MEHSAWLSASLVYLAAAVLAVPLARFAGLGSIIGYLAAGILIGPWGLKLVTRPEDMLQFAEFGVVLMLFLVGLELEPQRLWALRKPIFGWGSLQLFGSALLLALAAHAQTYAHKLAEYPRWPEMEFIEDCVECHVPGNARPLDRSMEPA